MALPPSSKYLQRAGDPVDETERESITTRLNKAFTSGQMSHDDYLEAMNLVYDARVLSDLIPVVEQVPSVADEVPAIVEQNGPPAGRVNEARNFAALGMAAAVAIAVVLTLLVIVILIILL